MIPTYLDHLQLNEMPNRLQT